MTDEHGKQDELDGTDGVKVKVNGINGEWLPDPVKIGETVVLQVHCYVKQAGKELISGEDGPVRDVAVLQVNGVKVIG